MTASSKTRRPAKRTRRKILILDSQPSASKHLAAVIEAEPDLAVCGVFNRKAEVLDIVRKLKPNLVVLEAAARGHRWLDHLRSIRAVHGRLPVLVWSKGPCSSYGMAAVRAGASAYVCHHDIGPATLATIRSILRGQPWLCHTMTSRLVRKVSLGFADSQLPPVRRLDQRERAVFTLLARRWSARRIARELHRTEPEIKTCCDRLKTKLQMRGTRELQCAAIRWMKNRSPRTS